MSLGIKMGVQYRYGADLILIIAPKDFYFILFFLFWDWELSFGLILFYASFWSLIMGICAYESSNYSCD